MIFSASTYMVPKYLVALQRRRSLIGAAAWRDGIIRTAIICGIVVVVVIVVVIVVVVVVVDVVVVIRCMCLAVA